MNLKIDPLAEKIIETLSKAGYEAYVVGGAVRDMLLSRPTKDWDVTTNAIPEQVLPLFTESFYDNNYGTVMVAAKHLKQQFKIGESINDDDVYDITTYRSEEGYSDKRRPDKVTWGKSIEEDLKRRDFTVNAIALSIPVIQYSGTPVAEYEVEIIDPYNGQEDIKNGVIRAVGKAQDRFEEDALRIMRAVRIAAQLGFIIEPATIAAITKNAANLKAISAERIGAEFMKIMESENGADGIMLMASCGILQVIIPELISTKEIKQGGHHIYDVFTHSSNKSSNRSVGHFGIIDKHMPSN